MLYCGNILWLGVIGIFGVGKSIFFEVFGMLLIWEGLKVVVIVVDFSSLVIGGSIFGDKICMNDLVCVEVVFICLVLFFGYLGGVS